METKEQVRKQSPGNSMIREYRGRRYYAGAGGSHHLFPGFNKGDDKAEFRKKKKRKRFGHRISK